MLLDVHRDALPAVRIMRIRAESHRHIQLRQCSRYDGHGRAGNHGLGRHLSEERLLAGDDDHSPEQRFAHHAVQFACCDVRCGGLTNQTREAADAG